jgi:hypothetical protein
MLRRKETYAKQVWYSEPRGINAQPNCVISCVPVK